MSCVLQVISVKETTASMLGTKVEIQLVKAEPMSWSRLEVPKKHVAKAQEEDDVEEKCEIIEQKVDTLDLDDLELVSNTYQLSTEASTIRP
jgi:cysteine/histidine-rich domain-containing protein